jgi:hypothetical protein
LQTTATYFSHKAKAEKQMRHRWCLALMHSSTGLEMTPEQFGKFAQAASEDHGVGEAIQVAFIDALKAADIPFGEE